MDATAPAVPSASELPERVLGAGQQSLAPGEFRADVVTVDGSTHVLVRGELDLQTADVLWATSRPAVDRLPSGGTLVIDLSALGFIDAAGLGVLVRLANCLRSEGKSLQVKAECPSMQRIFEIARLSGLLTTPTQSGVDPAEVGR